MYVSHHLEEMFEIGDRVTVLRDGKFAASAPMREYDHDSLIAAMVGRKIESLYPASNRTIGAPRLVVTGLRPKGVDGTIDFTVHSGEILGIAGLLGSGRTSCSGPSSGPTRSTAGRSRSTANGCRPATPARPCRPGSGC